MVIKLSKNDLPNKEEINTEGEHKNPAFIEKLNDFFIKLSRVPLKEKLFFVQHLGIMLKAGISLSSALKTLSKQSNNAHFRKILLDVGNKVEKGSSFADSLKGYTDVFGELFVSMVEAGEISGKLENVLGQLFIQMKKENKLISKVKGALTYPAVIIIAMLGIGTFMIVVVVPKITSMFSELGAELPLATKILISTSNAVVNNGILVGSGTLIFIILFIKTIHTEKGKYVLQGILLKSPIFATIIKKINLARFARNISSLLQTDIMIVKSFQITANVLGNLHYRRALLDMSQRIKKGEKLSDAINNYPHLFTPVVAQMVAVGEETGELDTILIELAEFYEDEVDLIMENLPSIIEPLLILFLGLGVGGVAVAIVMPMFAITSSV